MLHVHLHDVKLARVNVFQSDGKTHGSVAIACKDGAEIKLFTTPDKAQAIADAVNQPVPDLLCDIDPRLGELTQTGPHTYLYGDYTIVKQNPPIPGIFWGWLSKSRGGGETEHEGMCNSIFECLDECDEHREERAEMEAEWEREAELREMADDDRAHAAMDRARGL